MESIMSTFVGMFFPHTIEIDEANKKAYFLLYETYSARYSVKVIADKSIVAATLKTYDSSWDLNTIVNVTYPLLIVATGLMAQQPSVSGFLGRAVEEKFHIKPFVLNIIPCIPMVSERLKDMVHPEIGPTQLGKGPKEGYFCVNLSLDQNFENGPEFYTTAAADEELNEFEEMLLADMNQNNQRPNDDDEISEAPARNNRNHTQNLSDNESVDFFSHNPLPKRFSEYGKNRCISEKLIDDLQQLSKEINEIIANNGDEIDDDNNGSVTSQQTDRPMNKAINSLKNNKQISNVTQSEENHLSPAFSDDNYSELAESNGYDGTATLIKSVVSTFINYPSSSPMSEHVDKAEKPTKHKRFTAKEKGKQKATQKDFLSNESSTISFSGYISDGSYDNTTSSSHLPITFPDDPSTSCNQLSDFNDTSNYTSSLSIAPSKRRLSGQEISSPVRMRINEANTENTSIIRGRGRPKKAKNPNDTENSTKVKRGRGRPKKQVNESEPEDINKYLFNFTSSKKSNKE